MGWMLTIVQLLTGNRQNNRSRAQQDATNYAEIRIHVIKILKTNHAEELR